jgi:hypothetical protein
MMMLCNVQNGWPSGARFIFNSYKHWASLVIRNNDDTGEFLFSRQLTMFGYALGLLPFTLQLNAEFLEVEQPWYADDAFQPHSSNV